jgi:putative DNA primase/helicase
LGDGHDAPRAATAQTTTLSAQERAVSALDPFAKLRLWVTWRAETRQGKATKVPWAPELKWTRASSTDATTWGTRLLAEESARFDGRDGIGIMLAPLGEGRHLGGIDLDSCIGDEGDVASWAREIVELVNSYTEVSPSGHGLKIYLEHDPRETLAEGMRWRKAVRRPSPNGGKEPGIEFYLDRRYFAVTDQLFEGFDTVRHVGLDTLRDVQRRMEAFAAKPKPCEHHPHRHDDEQQRILDAIGRMPNHDLHWEEWNTQGMAIYAATGGSSAGYAAFLGWSGRSSKFDQRECDDRWQHWHTSPPDQLTAGTIFHHADPAPRRRLERHMTKPAEKMVGAKGNGSALEPSGVVIREAGSYAVKPINWLWPNWLARGKLHIIAGAPGTAKTTLAIECAATISRGGTWPDGSVAIQGDVLIWSGEDDIEDTLAPRLIAAGADLTRVKFIEATKDENGPRPFDPAIDMPRLARAIFDMEATPALVIVDPVASTVVGDSHKAAEVRAGLQPLVSLAASLHFAALGNHHFAKNTQGREPMERLIGSIGFAAAARIVLVVVRPADHDAAFRLVRAKSNIGPTGGGFEYRLLQSFAVAGDERVSAQSIEWGQPLDGSPRELLGVEEFDKQRDALGEAMEFLRDFLADGPKPVSEVYTAGDANGHARITLKRAKGIIGAKAIKDGLKGGWTWEMQQLPKGIMLDEP